MKKPLIYGISALILISFGFYYSNKKNTPVHQLTTGIKSGLFEVVITASGELRSKDQTDITAPNELRSANISQIKIADIIPEGTVVKAGDYVASLDKTELMTKYSESNLELQKRLGELKQTRLDTTLSLRDAREDLTNTRYSMQEKKLIMEQSRYEAPAVIQQVQLDYERTARSYEQKQENYKTKLLQALTKMELANNEVAKAQGKVDQIKNVMQKLEIHAPKEGMLIYKKDWNGKKLSAGSSINVWWGGTVAQLPNLNEMEAVTYVNEVDIGKVKAGQKVKMTLDADAGKLLEGVVSSVANIGETRGSSNAKVFEVVVEILTKDSTLRPAMTASCKIATASYQEALYIPLECINTENKISFIYLQEGGGSVKQQVVIGTNNETDALIINGVNMGQTAYLSVPPDTAGLSLRKIDSTATRWPPANPVIDSVWLKKRNETPLPTGGEVNLQSF